MRKRILVNREECEVRVAFVEDDKLVELHTEKSQERHIVNNIYRGRVQDVVPGLQAAFVDVGLERNVFLHFMDIRPESLVLHNEDAQEALREASKEQLPGRIERRGRRPRQDPRSSQAESPVKRGDDIIVQVVKDEIGGKAPRVTTNLSLPGRYLVLLPFPSQEGGVSRKIALGQNRYRLKKLLASIKDEDHSYIVRTAGVDQSEEAIQQDAEHLCEMWAAIINAYQQRETPGLIYNDHDLLVRMVRDAFPPDFSEVVCDHPEDAETVRQQLSRLMPDNVERIREYKGVENIFENFGIETLLERALCRKVPLKSGGSLIIDENEALTAIDINTGRFTGRKDQEKTSLRTNMEACEIIAQQIRLRDIGGIIVIDFIDMLSKSHQEKVSEELRRHLRHDRAKTAVGRIGDFGLMMLTRKRVRMSMQNQAFDPCPYCSGTGLVLTEDEIFRRLKYDLRKMLTVKKRPKGVVISVHPKFLDHLGSRFSQYLERLKYGTKVDLLFRGDSDFHLEEYQLTALDEPARGSNRFSTSHIEIDGRAEDYHRYHEKRDGAGESIDSESYAAADLPEMEGQVLTLEQVSGPSESLKDSEDESDRFVESAAGGIRGVVTPDSVPHPEERDGDDGGEDEAPQGAKKKRRRRESSSERRARRRRAKQERLAAERQARTDGASAQVDETVSQSDDKKADEGEPLAASASSTPDVGASDQQSSNGRRQRKPRPPRRDRPARLESDSDKAEPTLPESTSATPAPEEDPKEQEAKATGTSGRRSRTRRGSRGGRSSRRSDEKPAASEAPAEATVAKDEPKPEAVAAKAPAPAAPSPPPASSGNPRSGDLLKQVELALENIEIKEATKAAAPVVEAEPVKKTTRRKAPAKKAATTKAKAKTATSAKKPAAAKKPAKAKATATTAEKKPAKKTARAPKTTRAKKEPAGTKAKAVKEPKATAAKAEKKPAKTTAKRAPRKAATTRTRAKKTEEKKES